MNKDFYYKPPRTHAQVKALQRAINRFTKKYLLDVTELRVDGELGPATKKRIKFVKYYLGFNERNSYPNTAFLKAVHHPRWKHLSNPRRLARAVKRRVEQRHQARKHREEARKTHGVGHFDGIAVANWLIPYLQWARNNGWRGRLVSGWRDPIYSEQLCYRMCGAPSCPGKCAGRSSNHSGSDKPRGAIDVSYYYEFGQCMKRCPIEPHIYNALGVRDPVHFSASGR